MKAFTVEAGGIPLFVREWGDVDRPTLLFWDGLAGGGLHANEIAPVLTQEYGLRVIAPDAPGHGRSPALPLESYRPSTLAQVAADLLSALGLSRATFVGFSWGGRIGCSFAAFFPERTTNLALIEGGYLGWEDLPGFDSTADLEACTADARRETEEDSFASWEAFVAFQRESLRRWSPALAEAHRAMMREADGRVVPILEPEVLGAIKHGGRQEPVTGTYPLIADADVPVLLLTASEPGELEAAAEAAIVRFRSALPKARVESMPGAVHDLVSYAPAEVAEIVGGFVASQASA